MKTIKRTKEFITNYETLYRAWVEVRKGKTFTSKVLEYESNLVVNLVNLQSRLIDGTYKPKGYKVFSIYEPKERIIKAPYLEDRIVHHALLLAVGKTLDRRMVENSYACRIGKGTHKASEKLQSNLIAYKNKGYCLKIDIKKYFYNINHEVLFSILKKHIKCSFALNLFKMFFDAEGKGIPLGNVTSQLLANLYLNELDHFAKRKLKVKHYNRYMDDILILHHNKSVLNNYLARMELFIENLGVETNSKTKISQIRESVDYVGYRTLYNRKIIRKSSLFRIKRKLKKEATLQRVSSFLSHSKDTASLNYVVDIIKYVSNPETTKFINKWVRRNTNENF